VIAFDNSFSAVFKTTDTAQAIRNSGSIVGEQTSGTGGIAFDIGVDTYFHFIGACNFGTLGVSDATAAANPPRLWVRNGALFGDGILQTGNSGTLTYRGVANTRPGWLAVGNPDSPYSGLAAYTGTNVDSPAMVMYGAGDNAAQFLALDFGSPLSAGRLVGAINNQGDFEIGRDIKLNTGTGGIEGKSIVVVAGGAHNLARRVKGGKITSTFCVKGDAARYALASDTACCTKGATSLDVYQSLPAYDCAQIGAPSIMEYVTLVRAIITPPILYWS